MARRGTSATAEDLSALDAYLDKLSDEQALSLYLRCHQELRDAQVAHAEHTRDDRARNSQTRKQLIDYLTKHAEVVDCIQLDGERPQYLRLYKRATAGETIGPKLASDVLSSLTVAAVRQRTQEIADACARRFETWLAKEKGRVRADMRKRNREQKAAGRKPELDPKDDSAVAAAVRRPDEGGAKHDPTARRPQRQLPLLDKPLTRRQMLGELVYGLIKDRNKPQVPTLRVTQKPGAAVNIVPAARLGPIVQEVANRYHASRVRLAEATQGQRAARNKKQLLLRKCTPRVVNYLREANPDHLRVKKQLPLGGVARTVAVSVLQNPTCRKPSLWDASQAIDETVGALRVAGLDELFRTEDAAWLLQESIMTSLYRDLNQKLATFQRGCPQPRLCVRRIREEKLPDGRVVDVEEGEPDDDEEEDEDDEDDDGEDE